MTAGKLFSGAIVRRVLDLGRVFVAGIGEYSPTFPRCVRKRIYMLLTMLLAI